MSEPSPLPPRRVAFSLPLSRPIATWAILGCLLAVFLAETLAGGSTQIEVLLRMGAKVNVLIANGQYWRLATCMFLHIGVVHLAFNAYAVVAIGVDLERILGWRRFLAVYLLSGLFGSLASYALSPGIAAGASGAIFGLIGALAAFFLLHRERLGTWGRNRLANIAFLIAINLFFGFSQRGIDNWAHLGGLLSGLALGWAVAPRYEVDAYSLRLVDRNRLGRYWPALALAFGLFVVGTLAVTLVRRNLVQGRLWRAELAAERGCWSDGFSLLERVTGTSAGGIGPGAWCLGGRAPRGPNENPLAGAAPRWFVLRRSNEVRYDFVKGCNGPPIGGRRQLVPGYRV